MKVGIRGRSRIRRSYILRRDSDRRRRRRSCLAIRQSSRALWYIDGRLRRGDDCDTLLGLPILCLWRRCSIPHLASFRIRPRCCHLRMLTLWHLDVEIIVYCALIRSRAGLGWSAERVSRHAGRGRVCWVRGGYGISERALEVVGRHRRMYAVRLVSEHGICCSDN